MKTDTKFRLVTLTQSIALTWGVILVGAFLFQGCACNENERVRNNGGSMTIDLPKCEKLLNATWKDNEFWYLTRPFAPGETPTTTTFREKSVHGFQEGTVTLKESCDAR